MVILQFLLNAPGPQNRPKKICQEPEDAWTPDSGRTGIFNQTPSGGLFTSHSSAVQYFSSALVSFVPHLFLLASEFLFHNTPTGGLGRCAASAA